MNKPIIIILALGALTVGAGFAIYKQQNKLSSKDFDIIVGLSKNKGYDIFDDVSPRELDAMQNNYLKYFNRDMHNTFLSLLQAGESKLSTKGKTQLNNFINQLTKGLK